MATDILTQLLIIFLITIAIIAICRRAKFPPIIGYLIAGLLISIIGKNSFRHFEDLNVLAKYGVVFLMFTIGLEFSLSHLLAIRKTVFGLGSLQMLLCGGVTYCLAQVFNLPNSNDFIIAIAIAMSSTAIASKILTETGELNTNVGRLSMSMLIFQDLMVVPAIIVTNFIAQDLNGNIVSSLTFDLIKGIFTFSVLVIVGRKIFTPIFDEVARARSNELFTLTTLFIVLGAAYFSDLMGMSKEFGAFLAGAIIGGTPYRHQIEGDIRPFRDVLLGLFFIGIGTMLNINILTQFYGWIIAIGFAIVIGKMLIISILVKLLKQGNNIDSLKIGLFLAQASEFGFVLIALASHYNFFLNEPSQILLASLIISIFISIILLRFEPTLMPLLNLILFQKREAEDSQPETIHYEKGAVIIIGYGRVGQWVGRSLISQHHEFIALDIDPTLVNQAKLAGESVIYANATNIHVLQSLYIGNASAIVITMHNPIISLKILAAIRSINRDIPIIVRTKDDNDIERLMSAGATQVIADALEASLMMSLHLLVNLGMDLKQAIDWSENLRRDRYTLLKGYFLGEAEEFTDDTEQVFQQRAIMIEPGYAAQDNTLHALHPSAYNVKVIALRKNGILAPHPAPHARVQAGDVLVTTGHPDNLDRFTSFLIEGV